MSNNSSVHESQDTTSLNVFCRQIWLSIKKFFEQLVLRKEMSVLQAEIDTHNRLRRALSPIQMIGIGIGGIIGTGIFVLSGHAAANYAGPSIIIAFVLAGIVALLSALSMAEMSAMMSSSGSAYTYTYVALGEYAGFMIGWLSVLNYQLAASTVIAHWIQYVVHLINLISDYNVTSRIVQAPVAWSEESLSFYATGQTMNLPSIVITIAIMILLIIGTRETAIVNLILVIIKVIILLIFILACCAYVNRNNYQPFVRPDENSFGNAGITGMLHAATVVFFAYAGFEGVTAVAQEAKQPARTLPIVLIVPLIISLLIYVGVSTVLVGLVSYHILNTTYPIIKAAKTTPYGNWLPILLTLGAIISLTTVATCNLLAQSRIFYAMSYDGLLPPIFSRVQRYTNTPWISITVSGTICVFLSGFCPVDVLGDSAAIAALITYLFVHVCVIVMRYRDEHMSQSFQVPFGPWLIPGFGILLCLVLLIHTSKGAAIRFGIWMAIGQIVYFVYGYQHSKIRILARQEPCNSVVELVPPPEIYILDLSKTNSDRLDEETDI